MDWIYKGGSAILGSGLKLDVIQGMCRAYRNVKWHVISKKITGKTASISTMVNKQNIRFFMRLDKGHWHIYAMTSPDYKIDEKGLHTLK